jgi:hypothetical protein
MALSIQHLGLNEINQHVDGNTGPLYNITNDADLNANDVRVWGNSFGNSGYSGGSVNTGSGTEIAMGEFRGAAAPTNAFVGTMSTAYRLVSSNSQYVPNTSYSGFADSTYITPALGSHATTTYTGTIGGVSATHTLRAAVCSGFQFVYNPGQQSAGVIGFTITNNSAAYNTAATDWSSAQWGSVFTGTRASATNIYGNTTSAGGSQYNSNYYMSAAWGTIITTPMVVYPYATYFGTSSSTLSFQINL